MLKTSLTTCTESYVIAELRERLLADRGHGGDYVLDRPHLRLLRCRSNPSDVLERLARRAASHPQIATLDGTSSSTPTLDMLQIFVRQPRLVLALFFNRRDTSGAGATGGATSSRSYGHPEARGAAAPRHDQLRESRSVPTRATKIAIFGGSPWAMVSTSGAETCTFSMPNWVL